MKSRIWPFKYFVTYGKRNYLANVVALFVMVLITLLFVLFTGTDWFTRFVQYRALQVDGIEGTASLEQIFKGGGRGGTNAILYKFNTADNTIVFKREKIGRVVNEHSFSSVKKGMAIRIHYLPNEPAISLIAGNTAILKTRFYFLLFFSLFFCVAVLAFAGHWLRAKKLYRLESNGVKARKGKIVSITTVLLRGKRTRIDIQYTFFDLNGQKYRSIEKFWRPEAVKSLQENDAVTVMYSADLPKTNCILL